MHVVIIDRQATIDSTGWNRRVYELPHKGTSNMMEHDDSSQVALC